MWYLMTAKNEERPGYKGGLTMTRINESIDLLDSLTHYSNAKASLRHKAPPRGIKPLWGFRSLLGLLKKLLTAVTLSNRALSYRITVVLLNLHDKV